MRANLRAFAGLASAHPACPPHPRRLRPRPSRANHPAPAASATPKPKYLMSPELGFRARARPSCASARDRATNRHQIAKGLQRMRGLVWERTLQAATQATCLWTRARSGRRAKSCRGARVGAGSRGGRRAAGACATSAPAGGAPSGARRGGHACASGSGGGIGDAAVQKGGEVGGEFAGVVAGAVEQRGLAPAQELQPHHVHTR
jgi:hypothetical protein